MDILSGKQTDKRTFIWLQDVCLSHIIRVCVISPPNIYWAAGRRADRRLSSWLAKQQIKRQTCKQADEQDSQTGKRTFSWLLRGLWFMCVTHHTCVCHLFFFCFLKERGERVRRTSEQREEVRRNEEHEWGEGEGARRRSNKQGEGVRRRRSAGRWEGVGRRSEKQQVRSEKKRGERAGRRRITNDKYRKI